jgi:transcription elongation factor Elf1
MRIKRITDQRRRDFSADMECEHCGHESRLTTGYDDRNYHENVIPRMKCGECGKTARDDYRPLATRYPEGVQL